MNECKNLHIVFPKIGIPYGKYPLMNNGENINEYLQIKNVIINELRKSVLVVPNWECTFYNQDLDQLLCPYYVSKWLKGQIKTDESLNNLR